MSFEFKETTINGLIIIHPHLYADHRGLYTKIFEKNIYEENGITCEFTESSDIYSKKGALRGLHYQTNNSQAKLIHIVSGCLYDVALDLRKDSPTFGKCHEELMQSKDHKTLFIPEGFAHGFMALEDHTIFSYQCSGKYIPEACGGICWNDPDLNISWPMNEYSIDEVIITEKDRNWPTLAEYITLHNLKVN